MSGNVLELRAQAANHRKLARDYGSHRLWRKRESLLDIVLRREARAMAEFERRNELLK